MIKKLIITIFIIYSHGALTCSIDTYRYMVKTKSSFSLKKIIKSSDCSKDQQQDFSNFISTNSGEFESHSLRHYLGDDVNITPKKINITSITSFLKKNYSNKSLRFTKVKFVGKTPDIAFDKVSDIHLQCDQCERLGNRNFQIIQKGLKSKFWGSARLEQKTTAFLTKKTLGYSQNKLSDEDFLKTVIYTSHPENVFKSFKDIRFYKTNKNLKQNHILMKNDTTRAYLVKMGQPVQITLKDKTIQLSTIAIALKSGRLGDTISFRKASNGKTIYATITNYNKAIIDL